MAPLEARCERILEDIRTISQRIRRSALACEWNQASIQGVSVVKMLCRQMETICISCDALLEAVSLEDFTVDGQITDWLLSGGPRSCLDKLKGMEDMLKLDGRVRVPSRPLTSVEDQLAAVMASFEKHSTLFHFLLTPNVWSVS